MERQVMSHVSLDAECGLDEMSFIASLGKKYISQYVLGWFRMKGKYTTHNPKLSEIESMFKEMIIKPLSKLLQTDKIYADRGKTQPLLYPSSNSLT